MEFMSYTPNYFWQGETDPPPRIDDEGLHRPNESPYWRYEGTRQLHIRIRESRRHH
jgi:hypothetical protein